MLIPARRTYALVALAISAGASVRSGAAQTAWREMRRAHYSIMYQRGFERDATLVARWAEGAERLMRQKYGVTPAHYRMAFYLYPTPTSGIDAHNARNRCCTDSTASVSTGTIEMLTPSAPAIRDRHAISSLGLPKNQEDYQAKVLMSEYIPIGHYEVQRARPHGGWNYYDAPNWFVQGLQEYDGIFHTTPANRAVTARRLIAWAAAHRGVFSCCDPDVAISDAYNGGATFMAFLAAQFGEDIHARLLRDSASTFAAALTTVTRPYSRPQLFALFTRYLSAQALTARPLSDTAAQTIARRIAVPIDRTDRSLGQAALTIDLGAPFDPGKPTVLVIEDGQQYFVRAGAMAALQQQLFGSGVNVAGLIPRGSDSAFIAATIRADGSVDWLRAWRIFNSGEWIADIDAARQALVGGDGSIDLYGRSGGAYLVHEYLAVHATRVRRAFTQAAVEPSLNRELHIALDDYVEHLERTDSSLWRTLSQALPPGGEARLRTLVTLQRQHFYVPADSLVTAQRALIAALAGRDTAALRRFETRYEVDDIMQLERSREVIPQNVRALELIFPSGAFGDTAAGSIHPLVESQATFIRPLLTLVAEGRIAVQARDARQAHRAATEVFVLAAHGDEAVDYRTSIALANQYPDHELFIADDNHVFEAMDRVGARAGLVRAFFTDGPQSSAFAMALRAAEPFRWRPNSTP